MPVRGFGLPIESGQLREIVVPADGPRRRPGT
jgi:hypothetical protein